MKNILSHKIDSLILSQSMLTQYPMLAELLTLELMVIINICSSTGKSIIIKK